MGHLVVLLLFGYISVLNPVGSGSRPDSVCAERTTQPIHVDGLLNEPAWETAPPIRNFKERDPNEGTKPSEKTVVRVLYDNNAIYIGARMYDNAPDSIVAQLGRRDANLTADDFTVYLDPYNDKQTGFYFGVNAAGAISDGTLYNDTWDDDSWDGVWSGKAHIDSVGWTVEMRIPYSQLRFEKKKDNVWGIDFMRMIARKNEKDYLQYTPKNGNGFVSRFDNLVGIDNIKPTHHFEITPYLTSKASCLEHDAGDPFNKGSQYNFNAGVDLKTSIGSNLTLNGTINPDFGQVEVDPAVVNLSDVETFYPEKRPFFIEGSSFFNFGQGGATSYWGFNWWNPTFFYTRRIGQRPQGSVPDADYTDFPDATHIIGAAKLTGREKGNWNIGVLQAVTAKEDARYTIGTDQHRIPVEPLTYYGVARAQKQFNDARQSIGILTTFTQRSMNSNVLKDQFNNNAAVIGLDGWTFLDRDRSWVVSGWMAMSHLTGTRQRMLDVQSNSTHYLQMPDARSYSIDSTATSLTGYATRIQINKQKGNVIVNSAIGIISPRFDLNDVGFLPWTDKINMHFAGGYKWTKPTNWYRSADVLGAVFATFDYDGDPTWSGVWNSVSLEFLNYLNVQLNTAYNPKTFNDRLTRGGPLTVNKPGIEFSPSLSTDSRKAVVLSLWGDGYYDQDGSISRSIGSDITWKPASSLSLTVSPEYDWNIDKAHYVDTFPDPYAVNTFDHRYVFAELNQHTVSSSIRINWTFTPKLSLQMYMQPLISAGSYTNFKELSRPKSYDFLIYGRDGSTFNPQTHMADPDGPGPAASIDVGNPNFNYRSLRGDAILRWEFHPGSTLYFVWTQSRSSTLQTGRFGFTHSINHLFDSHPNNIFLVKFSYWMNV
ncbi:MAG TPA: DUF5916 domain-containing protein [Balneolales bacterium]|nr:DUF5916 domain-containing protein [Balneolales bacterium]